MKRPELRVPQHNSWTQEEDEILLKVIGQRMGDFGYNDICKKLPHRTITAIQSRIGKLRRANDIQVNAPMEPRNRAPVSNIGRPKMGEDRVLQPANIPCLRCRKTFDSWDKRSNRICQPCTISDEWNTTGVTHSTFRRSI